MNSQIDNNQLEAVLEIINQLAEEAASGDYIYRGEPDYCCGKVSSRLYREECKNIKVDGFDIEVVQQEILKDAKQYTTLTDELEILSELQHYGGNTNLIDFTTDYLIALFFACNSLLGKDGRVILLENTGESINQPRNPLNRIIAQKSRFIRPKQGFIEREKYKVIKISKELKPHILTHLQKSHGISTETIYNDLHGFIRNRSTHQSAYIEFYRALTYQDKGDNEKDQATEHYNNAIKHYGKAIELKPDLAEAYNNRGNAYEKQGNHDQAIQDHNKAIELNPNLAEAYNNRGSAHGRKGDYGQAIQDHSKAIELNPNYADAYYNRGLAHDKKGDYDQAIRDFDQAIVLQPDDAIAYFNRGMVWLAKRAWDEAKSDLKDARKKDLNIVKRFSDTIGSVSALEKKYGIQLPKDIGHMLTE